MLAVGAGIDYSRIVTAREVLQQAVDAATLAGAGVSTAQRNAVAASTLRSVLGPSRLTNVSAIWTTNVDGSFTGAASASEALIVSGLAGVTTATVKATATAVASSSSTPASQTSAKVCALVLDPSSSQALLVNSGVTVNATNCEIDAASTGSPAAIFNSNDTLNVSKICVAGNNVIQNGGTVGALNTGCTTAANPFVSALPTVSVGSCTVSNQNYAGANSLSPGTYCGNFNFNGTGTLNLQPGLYVFSNTNWNINSGWTVSGAGVTFYFADSNSYIQVNGGATMNVSAPTTGTYANILMFEPDGLAKSSYTINGSSGHQLNGLIYQPSRNITFNSQSNVNTEYFTLVVNQLILDTLTWNVAAAPLSISPAGATKTTMALKLIK
ncbi:MAG: Tad domain-containing protein [Hyphomicrobiales bacterium]|nr:Tad domain-containing protein [Hyphomicrobiales bacterium]